VQLPHSPDNDNARQRARVHHGGLANKRPAACSGLLEPATITLIASKTRPSRHGHVYRSILCRDYKPEPTMSHGRVFHLLIVQKDANFKTQTSKFTI